MATWVTHLIIADNVLEQIPCLCKHSFCVGNIAPDCNVENADWSAFTPPREVTHWMGRGRKTAADCDRFLHEYMMQKTDLSLQETSFLLGYYSHLITDAEFQRYIRDEQRVTAAWNRLKQIPALCAASADMDATWGSIKQLISGKERMKDIYSFERAYLDSHPNSGYLTEILGLKTFPDYIAYLPPNAIPRKISVMGYMPQKELGQYPYIAMSKREYACFLAQATKLAVNAIGAYLQTQDIAF